MLRVLARRPARRDGGRGQDGAALERRTLKDADLRSRLVGTSMEAGLFLEPSSLYRVMKAGDAGCD
eukprot:CAMPEP_0184102996 /NCGR_PEP_ID=MMETSP0974-20121125/13625_1 /TAXON_ID=483370 /ORGANISM="non described non described, Strain CCMP2097" /LENGTH=65 /DNA_ID=CAMNT_0026405951 /DNA_START=1 /DNA_END=197 /DNA_ORIENTATION=-